MKKSTEKIYLSLALVWFTTHFGGGFASGRQVVEYFFGYGPVSILLPILSQGILALVFYAAWKYAFDNKAFNYKVWTDSFFSPVEKVMSNVYEVLYNTTLITATAVAFATGGATMTTVFGTSYMLNTGLIASALLLLTIFGAKFVRRTASVIAAVIVIGMFVIYVPNIIAGLPSITANLTQNTTVATGSGTFMDAVMTTLKYAGFQAVVMGAYIAHSNAIVNERDIKKAAITGFVLNSLMLVMTVLGLLIFLNDGILTDSVPTLTVVTNGVGAAWMVPLVSVMIILGAVSTGVNLIYGISNRIILYISRNDTSEVSKKKERPMSIVISSIYVLVTWSIAQFGLIPLVARGYGTIGYISIFALIIPIIVKFYLVDKSKKSKLAKEAA